MTDEKSLEALREELLKGFQRETYQIVLTIFTESTACNQLIGPFSSLQFANDAHDRLLYNYVKATEKNPKAMIGIVGTVIRIS